MNISTTSARQRRRARQIFIFRKIQS